jgi:carbonic anhydrase
MCEICRSAYSVTRRSALTFTASALAASLIGRPAMAASEKTPPKPQNVISPDAALDRLTKGNSRYVRGTTLRHDFAHEREALSTGQNPFAAILSCADSRIAPELCFDTARGDLFVCRVAGNFASDEMVASLEYAVAVLKTPLIMVLGHEACGAVDATIKSVKDSRPCPVICRHWSRLSSPRLMRSKGKAATCWPMRSGATSRSMSISSKMPPRS